MNNEIFQRARAAYATKDYETALRLYTECLQTGGSFAPGEAGLLYHQVGNCLIKLKNTSEAIQAYSQATADAAYDASGTVNYNLGMAYASLHDYENAVKYFEVALSDAKYDSPYKAYSGMGSALMKLGKSAEAGVAFREAALDDRNPDPTKALLNLGVCFMALDRPNDAVASYESALQFGMAPEVKNKLYANLGQAYVASGQMQKAVNAFEQAIADQTYFLSDSASVDYQRAIASLAQGTASITQANEPLGTDTLGLDVAAEDEGYAERDPYAPSEDPYAYSDEYNQQQSAADVGFDQGNESFFLTPGEGSEEWTNDLTNLPRKRRRIGLKIFIVILILIVIALGVAVFGYTQGYGYPTQETVVKELFADPENAASSLYAGDVDEQAAEALTALLVTDEEVTIEGMEKSMSMSTVYVTADTPEGGSIMYEVTLIRDMIGWKVSDVSLYFPSQN